MSQFSDPFFEDSFHAFESMLNKAAEVSSPLFGDAEPALSSLFRFVNHLRNRCDAVENILPTLSNTISLSQTIARKILNEAADVMKRQKYCEEEYNGTCSYTEFMREHFSNVLKMFDFCLDEVTNHFEQANDLLEQLSEFCSDLSVWKEDLHERLNEILDTLPSFAHEPSVMLDECNYGDA